MSRARGRSYGRNTATAAKNVAAMGPWACWAHYFRKVEPEPPDDWYWSCSRCGLKRTREEARRGFGSKGIRK